jgi:uncharacterized protein YkwD
MKFSYRDVPAGAVFLMLIALSTQCTWAQSLEEFNSDYLESPSSGPDLSDAEGIIVSQTNLLREEQGLKKVDRNKKLSQTARYFAAFMARTAKYGHTADGNRPSQRASLFEYEYCIVSENIAHVYSSAGFTSDELGKQFYEGWRDSPEHRKNMLNEYVTEIGVAVAYNPEGGRYYGVQMFGRPRSKAQRFQVANRTREQLAYSVVAVGEDAEKAKIFDLPAMSSRTHLGCRPTVVDWDWTEKADNVRPESRQLMTVSGEPSNYQVSTEQMAGGPEQRPQQK